MKQHYIPDPLPATEPSPLATLLMAIAALAVVVLITDILFTL